MADLYAKKLESERKTLWATCRLKGLAKDTPQRQRIAEIARLEKNVAPASFQPEGSTIYSAGR